MTAYRVTYFEAAADAAPAAAARLREFAAAMRRAAGNEGCDGLAEPGREGRFAIVEAWGDAAALDAQAAAAAAFRRQLRLQLIAPCDARPHVALSVAVAAPGAAAVHVLTHVDVVPANTDAAVALLQQLAADSRAEGALRCDVLQQTRRPNHLTLREAWADHGHFVAHAAAAHTRAFRERLAPLQGALYDERLYRLLA